MKIILCLVIPILFLSCSKDNQVEKEFFYLCKALDMRGLPNTQNACKCIIDKKLSKISDKEIEYIQSQDKAKIKFLSKQLYDNTKISKKDFEFCTMKMF